MLDLTEIRRRAVAATPGPWHYGTHCDDDKAIADIGAFMIFAEVEAIRDYERDAYFIAAARDDIPALIEEIEQLREALAQAMERVHCEQAMYQQQLEERQRIIDELQAKLDGRWIELDPNERGPMVEGASNE